MIGWNHRNAINVAAILGLLLAGMTFAGASDAKPGSGIESHHPGLEALDYAFRFASAIRTDAENKGKAQQVLVEDFARTGEFAAARRRADLVDSWRRGLAYVAVADAYADAGHEVEARELLSKASEYGGKVGGWQQIRITAHAAGVLAALGDSERSQEMAMRAASNDSRQYAARSAATIASGYAAAGDFEKAMDHLGQLDEATDRETNWWRTQGYLSVAREDVLSRNQRLHAIETARRSADHIRGWRRTEVLRTISEEFHSLGEKKRARETLEELETIVLPAAGTQPGGAATMASLSRSWVELGDSDRARKLLRQAEEAALRGMNIEQPGLYAQVAAAYANLGDQESAWRVFDRAFEISELLENSRPRALAAVSICRSIGKEGLDLDESKRVRLDALYDGLGDPW